MTREFIYPLQFDKKWKNLKLTDDDLILLENYLLDNPEIGSIMQGTGGLRKVRWSLPHRGKSGSIRVLYIDFGSYKKIYMVDLFVKNEKDNLTKEEQNLIKTVIKLIGEELKK